MGDALQAAVPLMIAAVLLWNGLRRPHTRELNRFANRFGVVLVDDNVAVVASRLRWSRAMRSAAGAAGVVVTGLPAYMNLIDAERAADFAIAPVGQAWLIAPALAAVAAEVLVVQRPTLRGKALIIERRPEHYVSPRWPRTATLVSAAAATFFLMALLRGDDGLGEASLGAVGAAAAFLAIRMGLRRVADRPRLSSEGHLRNVDDALRAYGAHHIAGAAVALAAISLSVAAEPVFNEVAPALNLLTGFTGTVALGIWYTVARDEPWSVPDPLGAHR